MDVVSRKRDIRAVSPDVTDILGPTFKRRTRSSRNHKGPEKKQAFTTNTMKELVMMYDKPPPTPNNFFEELKTAEEERESMFHPANKQLYYETEALTPSTEGTESVYSSSPPPTPGASLSNDSPTDNSPNTMPPSPHPDLIKATAMDDKPIPINLYEQWEKYGTSGKAITMKMKNFMSHRKFDLSGMWSPRMNIVTGANGSGKSAIMCAIAIALGSKAATTGKQKKLSDFINRDHPTDATIHLTLMNNGALDPKVYGSKVEIKRVIKTNQTNLVYIKMYRYMTKKKEYMSEKGKFVEVRKPHFLRILSDLNIDPTSPAQFLFQDQFRDTDGNDPLKSYKLFCRSTRIDFMEENLHQARSNIEASRSILREKEEIHRMELESLIPLEKQISDIRTTEKLLKQDLVLTKEFWWTRVHEQEEQIATLQNQKDAVSKEINLVEDKKQQAVKEKENNEEGVGFGEDRKQKLKRLIKDQERNLEKRKTVLKNTKADLSQVNAFILNTTEARRENEYKLKKEETNIKAVQAKKANTTEQKKTALLYDEGFYKHRYEELSEVHSQLQSEIKQQKGMAKNYLNRKKEKEDDVDQLQREIQKYKREASKKDSMAKYLRFDSRMPRLMELIQRNMSSFKKRPRGPQGACYTVQEKWAPLVEHINYRFIRKFCVDNAADREVLKRLIQEVYPKDAEPPEINVMRFDTNAQGKEQRLRHERRRNPKSLSQTTLLDVIEIENDDPIVFNWLMNYNYVDKLYLYENHDDATTDMESHQRVPFNCRRGYSLTFYEFIPTPNYSCFDLSIKKGPKILEITSKRDQNNYADIIASLKEDLARTIVELKEIDNEVNKYESKQHELNMLKQSKFVELQQLKVNLLKTQEELRELQGIIDTDVTSLTDIVEEFRGLIINQEKELMEYRQQEQDLKLQFKKAKEEHDEEKQKLDELQCEVDAIEENRTASEKQGAMLEHQVKILAKEIQELQKKKEKLEDEVAGQEEKLLTLIKKAQIRCPRDRVKVTRRCSEIREEYKAVKIRILKGKKLVMHKDLILQSYDNAKKRTGMTADALSTTNGLFTTLESLLRMQEKRLESHKVTKGSEVQSHFNALAAQRQYKGEVLMDHVQRKLVYTLDPYRTSISTQQDTYEFEIGSMKNSQLKDQHGSLSGGERSYKTFAFLLSLLESESKPSPFCMMDEPDVCMDARNKHLVYKFLEDYVKRHPTIQVFVFSPVVSYQSEFVRTLRLKSNKGNE